MNTGNPCRLCGQTLYPEVEIVLTAVILGIEAAAYATVVICTAVLVLHGLVRALRAVWR